MSDDATWPRTLDDLRREPGRLVFTSDLRRLGVARSYDGLKGLPPPLKLPGRRLAWEGRAILTAIGAYGAPLAAEQQHQSAA
ncbi:hypothetical protein [Falsiroseomonas oryzae]|uniref:hypothetical protein n=1 Tax=Falsiroseomonas oryzae TaxID=2766473 RepID=UPI0022EA4BFD|nr:hypothetical protein [Roseomonas sp. MO-31]